MSSSIPGHVLEHFNQDTAEAERDDLAEGGVGDRADDHLVPARDKLLDLYTVDGGL
jgi:hypothetical protein